MKNSNRKATGAMIRNSPRAIAKVALVTPPVARAMLYTIIPYTINNAMRAVKIMF